MTSFRSLVYTIPKDENLIKIVGHIDTRFLKRLKLIMKNLFGISKEI